MTIKEYNSNFNLFFNDKFINESFDGYDEYTTEENIEGLMEKYGLTRENFTDAEYLDLEIMIARRSKTE